MIKFVLPKSVLFVLILCLGWANAPAQGLEMRAPPIPDVIPPPPPDPDTLPAPPDLEWAPLVPQNSGLAQSPAETISVSAPEPEASIAPPAPPMVETPLPGAPDPSQIELVKPDVEVWREESENPQIPARLMSQLDQAYIAGTNPVVLRVQFNPLAAGKLVFVKPGPGITLNPVVTALTVSSSGECIFSAQLAADVPRSHIVFYCEGAKTVLPVVRASLAVVVRAEGDGE